MSNKYMYIVSVRLQYCIFIDVGLVAMQAKAWVQEFLFHCTTAKMQAL